MSGTWEDSLRELRNTFVDGSPARLAEIGALLGRAEESPCDPATLSDLALKFHSIAGTAGTFGFPEATALSRSAEALIESQTAEHGRLDADARARLAATLDGLRHVLLGTGGSVAGPTPSSGDGEAPAPFRILSVEDDPDHAAFVRTVLESGGHLVRVCSDASRFESDAIAFQPDLVLLDVNLPGASGYDLARDLRRNETWAAVPVVFLTAEARDDARIRSIRSGGDDHLVKPVAPGLLLATVTARLERARILKGLLTRDGLTGLTNHTAFLEGLKNVWKRSSRPPGRRFALVSLDIDLFKSVNDLHGHPAGDRVLAALGGLLLNRLRGTDLVGRIGGEEFAVVLEDIGEAEAVTLIERILRDFSRIEHGAGDSPAFRVTFSAGIAFLRPGATVEAWRGQADEALYAAKRAGRSRVVLA